MGKFNINQLLGAPAQAGPGPATEQSAAPPTLKVIPISINDLIPSSDNFYSIENIAELKASIEMFGVVQPLAVKPLEDGKYRIIAGHRRYTACMKLVAEGKREFAYIPCGIQGERDEIKERILLIMTNSTTRELSDWEKMKQAEELQKYFTVLKKRDNLPGRVRDLVAEALNTSVTQIARLNAISNNLLPELAGGFQAGKLGVSAAYELSGMTEEQQREAAAEFQEKGGLSLNDVKERKQEAPSPQSAVVSAVYCVECGAELTPEETHYYLNHCEICEKAAMEKLNEAEDTLQPVTATAAERPEPQYYPETPPDFEEGTGEDDEDAPEIQDFADMSEEEKAEAAVFFLNSKRYVLFSPGEDTRLLDYIIESFEKMPDMLTVFNYGNLCEVCAADCIDAGAEDGETYQCGCFKWRGKTSN
jgi:ParB family chromosome partitioning protein